MHDLIIASFRGHLSRSRLVVFLFTALGAGTATYLIPAIFGMGGAILAPARSLKTLLFFFGHYLALLVLILIGVMVLGAVARRLRDAGIDARWSALAGPPLAVSILLAGRPFIVAIADTPDILIHTPLFRDVAVGSVILLTTMVAILCALPGISQPDPSQPDDYSPEAALSRSQPISKTRFFGIVAFSHTAFLGLCYLGTLEFQRLDIDLHSQRQGVDGTPLFADFVFAFIVPYAPSTFILILLILIRCVLHFIKKVSLTRLALLVCCSPPLLSILYAVLVDIPYRN